MSSDEALRGGAPPESLRSGCAGVSVVIPSYRGPAALAETLLSLAAQTLDVRRFEAVVVVNGPAAADQAPFEELRRQVAPVRIRYLLTSTAGASLAWNLGVQAARMEWLTFLDDDDTVTASYLENLLELAVPGVVPLAQIHDRHPDGTLDTTTRLNTLIKRHAGATVSAGDLPQALGFNAAKLVPTRWAQAGAYDPRMTNGQDVAFFGTLSLHHDITFSVVAEETGAAYVRGVSGTSMSRQAASFDFSIEQRLHVVEALDRARLGSPRPRRAVAEHLVGAQVHLMNRYLVEHPDQRRVVLAAVAARRLSSFPYSSLNRDLATRLVVVDDGVAAPRRPAAELARLVTQWDEPVDVVAIARKRPPSSWVADFWRAESRRHLEGRWVGLELPLARAIAALDRIHGPTLPYREVRSLTRWGAAHHLAAALTARTRRPVGRDPFY